MPRSQQESEPLEKVPVRLYQDDLDWLRRQFRVNGYNRIVRLVVRRFRRTVERRQKGRTPNDRAAELEQLDDAFQGGEDS